MIRHILHSIKQAAGLSATRCALAILACVGCCLPTQAQQHYFRIEVQHRAVVQLPATPIGSLLLVNNTTPQPDDFGHQKKLNDANAGTTNADLRKAAQQVLFGLESSLFEQEAYDEVQVLDKTQNRSGNFYKRTILNKQQTDSLCRQYDVDAVLCLNQVAIYDLQETFYTDRDSYYSYLQAYCSTHWTLHIQGKAGVFQFSVADTLLWDSEHPDISRSITGLPEHRQALLDLAFYAGEQVGRKMFPQWEEEDRYLYTTKDPELTKAIELIRRQRWQEAHEALAAIVRNNKADALTRASAAADAAVCAEMLGDKKKAASWIDQGEPIWLGLRSAYARQQVINLRAYKKKL